MPAVSFYILSTQSAQRRNYFACKLVEKAYRSGHNLYILTESETQSNSLDELLWTFRAGSFIPHNIYSGQLPEIENCVLIGSHDTPENWQQIILNLSTNPPKYTQKTQRILEILDNNEETIKAGRCRYRYYQQHQLTIETHKI